MKRLFWLTLAAVLLVACQPTGPQRTFTKGDEVAYYDFDQTGTFEEGSYNEGQARLEITEGRYLITVLDGDGETWYGQWGAPIGDVVVDVEAQQLTDSPATVYGVGCRMRGSVGVNLVSDPALEDLAQANASSSGEIVALAEVTPEATEAVEAEVTAEATAEVTRSGSHAGSLPRSGGIQRDQYQQRRWLSVRRQRRRALCYPALARSQCHRTGGLDGQCGHSSRCRQ